MQRTEPHLLKEIAYSDSLCFVSLQLVFRLQNSGLKIISQNHLKFVILTINPLLIFITPSFLSHLEYFFRN